MRLREVKPRTQVRLTQGSIAKDEATALSWKETLLDQHATSGLDVKLPFQIATGNLASGKVNGPCPAASIGAVSALLRGT